jgi:hypothetical protein
MLIIYQVVLSFAEDVAVLTSDRETTGWSSAKIRPAMARPAPRPPPFTADIKKIEINPYVRVPKAVLSAVFEQAGRSRSPIPVKGTLDGKAFRQTLVKYRGAWRLYLNTPMRKAAGVDAGDDVRVTLAFDSSDRTIPMNPRLRAALTRKSGARAAFEALLPSRKKEINRYLNSLKTPEALARAVTNVLSLLDGKKPRGHRGVLRVGP